MIVGQNVAIRADNYARSEAFLPLLLRTLWQLPAKELLEKRIIEEWSLRSLNDPGRGRNPASFLGNPEGTSRRGDPDDLKIFW
jgi:hypothetical protein